MDITGIEIIRPGGAAVGVLPGEKIELTYGDTLKVNVSFDYRGAAENITLYGAIGERHPLWGWYPLPGFDEIINAEATHKTPASPTAFVPVTASVEIPITSDIDPGTDYDLYVKIKEYPEAGDPEVDDVIDIVGIPPTFDLIQHTIFPYAYIYDGKTDFSIFTCKTPSFIPTDWAAKKFAEAVESEVKKAGGRVIDLKVYVDKAGPFDLWENFRIEVEGTPLGAAQGVGVPVGIALWATILIIALSLALLIVVITWSIDTITKSFTHKPGLHEVKPGWGKETLKLTIHDSEEYWERPLTPAETLEGMSEDELRDYLDKIAEEEVPPGLPSWLPWAIIGGIVVVGGGVAAIALTTRRE